MSTNLPRLTPSITHIFWQHGISVIIHIVLFLSNSSCMQFFRVPSQTLKMQGLLPGISVPNPHLQSSTLPFNPISFFPSPISSKPLVFYPPNTHLHFSSPMYLHLLKLPTAKYINNIDRVT